MVLRGARLSLLLAAVVWSATGGQSTLAQQPQAKPPQAKPPAAKQAPRIYHDEYEPNHARRSRKQSCLRDEEEIGAYCVRSCRAGYAMLTDRHPPRCRSIDPLPPGQLPGPLRRDIGEQPMPPGHPKTPQKSPPGA